MSRPCITASPWRASSKYTDEDLNILFITALAYALSGHPNFTDRVATQAAMVDPQILCRQAMSDRMNLEHAFDNLALTQTYNQTEIDALLANMKRSTTADQRRALYYKVLGDLLAGYVQDAGTYS